MAQGLVIVLLNRATKLSREFQLLDKEYNAVFKLGLITDTWDLEGKVVRKEISVNIKEEKFRQVVTGMRGVFNQQPPIYSAKKIRGRPAYYYARKKDYDNRDIVLETNPVYINAIDILSFDGLDASIKVVCSSGTYIRSLIYEIGNRLGCGATLTGLVRNKIGYFCLKDSVKTSEIKSIAKNQDIQEFEKSIIDIDRLNKYLIKSKPGRIIE